MKDIKRTRERLINELVKLRRKITKLEKMKIKHLSTKKGVEKSKEKYGPLTDGILEGILIIDSTGKVLSCNKSAVEMFGYKKIEEGIGKNVYDYLSPEYREIVTEDMVKVFRGEGGFLAPYKAKTKYGKEFWVESLGRKITYQNKSAEVVVLRDITKRKHMEEELKKAKTELEKKVEVRTSELRIANEQLERLLKEIVGALASAVEAKDPYTAGHQQRVTQLACAIAKEMDLPEEQISGIYMAGIVHDIGKIHIPAEILTKPGELNKIELSMINTHPQLSYDILKTIEFPWPIARIVHQHHERINGSGYPLGLSGEDILFEARILAVADVVEAIATRRPYRPALGVDKAMEEISQKKDVCYDSDVVDACLKLFTEKRFKFKTALKRKERL